jgi:ferredoxin
MMDELKHGLITEGVVTANIHFERFGIDYDSSVVEKFNVKIGENKSIVFEQQRSLLDAIEEQGIEIQSECRSGECGQCKVNLRCGKVKPLIDIEMNLKAGEILACCCVPESNLLIDL